MKSKSAFRLVRTGSPAAYLLAAATAAMLGTHFSSAADFYWDGSGSPATGWEDFGNWSDDSSGTPSVGTPGLLDIAYFSIASVNTAQTVNLNASQAALGLVFLGTNTAATDLLGGSGDQILTLGTNGITVNTLAGPVTIGSATSGQNVAITLGGAQAWTNNSTNALTIQNAVSNGSNLLTVTGTGDTTINGVIGNGAGGLTKTGAGVLTLNNTNNYSGQTTVTLGTLNAAATNALGTGALLVNGGTLALGAFNNTVGAVTLTSGSITGSGGILTGTSFAVSSGSASAILDGTGATLTKTTAGTVTLSGENSYTGATTISQGALRISTINGLGTTASGTTVSATGAALQLNGAGITYDTEALSLTGTGISAGGALQNISGNNIWAGTVSMAADSAIGVAADTFTVSGAISGAGSARALTLTAASGATGILSTAFGTNVGAITKIGTGTWELQANNATYTANIGVNAGTLTLSGAGIIGGTGTVTVQPGATLNLANAVTNRLGGRALTLSGGTLNLSGAAAETTGLLTLSAGQSVINNNSLSTLTLGAVAPTRNAGATALFKGGSAINFGATPAFTGQTGGNGLNNKGILPWAIFDTGSGLGSSFATTDVSPGATVRGLGIGEFVNNLTTANANVVLSDSNPGSTNGANINSLTFNTGTSAVTINSPTLLLPTVQTLTLGSGGILSNVAASGIGGGVVAVGNGIVFTPGANAAANVLTISSAVTGTTLSKAGAGTLALTSVSGAYPTYSANNFAGSAHTGAFYINEGVVQLGANNALYCGNFNDANSLNLYSGGTLDLNGKTQFVGALYGQAFGANVSAQYVTGGTISSSTGYGNILSFGGNPGGDGNFKFGGSITGANVGFARGGSYTQYMSGSNSYEGPTLVCGGGVNLRDDGTMSGTSDVSINYSTLTLDNTGFSNNDNRLNNSAAITLSGGVLTYNGRAQTASTETVGALTLAQGVSTINVTPGGTGVNSADLTLNGLISRSATSAATVNFQGTNLGVAGNNSRLNVSGATAADVVPGGLVNNIIPWATVGRADFASYIPYTGTAGGIGALGQTGYSAYTPGNVPVVDNLTGNYKQSNPVIGTSVTINSLNLNGSGITFTAGTEVLNLVSGGLLRGSGTGSIGATVDSGRITSGGSAASGTSDLYIFSNNNNMAVRSRIIDNGFGASTRLVVWGDESSRVDFYNGNNSHTGGTVLSSGGNAVTLNASSGVIFPNATNPSDGLILNATPLTMNVSAGQIGSGNIVTLNGNSSLTLFGNNTLAGLVLNNIGGGSPTVTTFTTASGTGTLNLTGGITTTSNNVAGIPQINGRVNLPSGVTLSVGAGTFNGEIINPIQTDLILNAVTGGGGTMTKSGTGVLQFNLPTTLTGTLDVTGGGLKSNLANAGGSLMDLNLGNGTTLNLNNFDTLYGSLSGDTAVVTNTGSSIKTLTVGYTGASGTFAGSFMRYNDSLVNSINLTKIGSGTMALTGNSSTASGTLTVHSGGVTFQDNGVNNFLAGAVLVNPSGTLTFDNTGTSVDNRLQNRALTLSGGTLKFIGDSTTENIGALTTNSGLNVIDASGSGTLSFSSLVNHPTGGVVNFKSADTAAIQFAATTTITDGILMGGSSASTAAGYFFNGVDFATSTGLANAPITAYAGYTTGDFGAQASSTTINFKPTGAQTMVNASKSINTLNLTGGVGVTLAPGAVLTIDGSAIINDGGGDITGGVLTTAGNNELILNSTDAMTIGSVFQGSNQKWVKVGAGNVTFTAKQNMSSSFLNEGSLTLAAGDNTLSTQGLVINGGILDLGSNSQYLNSLTSVGTVPGSSGIVTGTGGTLATKSGGTFAGQFQGSLNLVLGGGGTLTLVDDSNTTGTVTVQGGLTLKDSGRLSGTTGLDVNYSTLTLDNSGLSNENDRINDAAPITLSGATLTLTGRAGTDSSESLGAVTLGTGISYINPVAGTTGTATVTLASLAFDPGAMMYLPADPATGIVMGGIAYGPRLMVSGTAPTTINGVVPGVVFRRGDDEGYMAGYSPTQGFVQAGQSGGPTQVTVLAGAGSTDNVRVAWGSGAQTVAPGGQTINSYEGRDQAAVVLFQAATDTLTLSSGNIYTNRTGSQAWATTALRGAVTSATEDLFWFNFGLNLTMNSVIKDNGTDAVRFVMGGSGSMTLTAANQHTGGTVVNGPMTLNATAGAGTVVIPNAATPADGLVINNVTLTSSVAGQIGSDNIVTLNGGANLTLNGANTLAGIVFNSNGGSNTTPTVTSGGVLTLTGDIVSTNTNYQATANPTNTGAQAPTIAGTLDLNGTTSHTITVNEGVGNFNGLTIGAVIQNGGFTKDGEGVLYLNNTANTFAGGINVTAGVLTLGQGSADGTLGANGNVVTLNGATAALWLRNSSITANHSIDVGANGGTLASEGARSTTMPISLTGTLTASTVDPIGAGNNSAGSGDLTLSGQITGGGAMNITGNPNFTHTVFLNNATNNYTGGTTVSAGGRLRAVAGGLGDVNGSLTVNTGGTFIMNAVSHSVGNFTGTGGTVVNNQNSPATLTIGSGDATGGDYQGVLANKELWSGATNTLSLTKVGLGTQTLSGTNTYTGATNVNEGTLLINGANTGTGLVTVGTGGTLGGTGSIAGAINVTGTGILSPGASIGTLTSGALTLASTSTYQYQVNSSTVGADLQIVNGALALGGATLNLADLGAGTFGGGTVFSLFNYSGALSGLFTYDSSTLNDEDPFSFLGKTWIIDYNATTKGDNVVAAEAGSYVNISISGVALTPYEEWIQTPAFGIPGGLQGAGADADNDGIKNINEFAFDTLPNTGSSGPGAIAYAGAGVTAHGQPILVTGNTAVFGRRLTAVADGLTYTVEFSADLVNWATSATTPTQIATDATTEAVSVAYPASITTPGGGTQVPKFFRVLVSLAP